ncbi:MAG: hypothetical protein RMA76_12255 [Deltaproteobacteria bacterium]|jgi:hypothetical protein
MSQKLIVPKGPQLIRPDGLQLPERDKRLTPPQLIQPKDGGGLILPGQDGGEVARMTGRVRGTDATDAAMRALEQRQSSGGFVDLNDPRWKV